MCIKSKINNAVDELFPKLIDYSCRLIEFKTVSGNEKEAQEYLKSEFEKRGCNTDIWEPDINKLREYSFFNGSRESFAGSPNLAAILKGKSVGKSLMINGHIDVVPAEDIEKWDSDPFTAVVKNGEIIGRGISDMKCCQALSLFVLDVLKYLNIQLKGDLIFASVIDEETGGAGSLALAQRGYSADAAILPEPNDFAVAVASQGVAYFKIYVEGLQAHGGTRYLGISAIEKSVKVIEAIKVLESSRTKRLKHWLYEDKPIPFAINLGKMDAGEWPSMVAGKATIEGRYGIAPQESIEDARAEFENCLQELKNDDEWFMEHPVKLEWTANFLQSGEISKDHPFVETLKDSFENITGEKAIVAGTPFGTDAGTLIRQANTPAVVFGPGRCAHNANESIELKKLNKYAKILINTIVNWCGISED